MLQNDSSAITNFLEKLSVEDGLSPNTISSYNLDLQLFSKFLKTKSTACQNVTADILKDYLLELHQQNLRSSSISRKLACLKRFYQFLLSENLLKIDPTFNLHSPKAGKKLPKFLSEAEMMKMLNHINSDKSEFGIKLSCMLEILYASGLRVTELVSLPVSEIHEITNEKGEKTLRNYLIVKGKGNKERIAPLNKAALRMLIEYLEMRKKLRQDSSKWLFVGMVRSSKKQGEVKERMWQKKDTHITRQRFHQMLKELAIKAGLDPSRIHPHVIRHSFATHLLNSGVDLRILQELLGHSDISTTEIYTHILDSKLKDLVFKHHPLAQQ